MMTEQALREFVVEAKRATYAGCGNKAVPSRLKSKDLPYEKGPFKYLDSYVGDLHFAGEEIVWYQEDPVWGMNYYGTLFDDAPEAFGAFLKEALRRVEPEAPYRGPRSYQQGELEFRCCWQGELSFFQGEEEIYYRGKLLYKLLFHGGRLQMA